MFGAARSPASMQPLRTQHDQQAGGTCRYVQGGEMLAAVLLASVSACASVVSASPSLLRGRRLAPSAWAADVAELVNEYEVHDFGSHGEHRRALEEVGQARIELPLHVLGRRLTLDLRRNDELFAKGYTHKILGESGDVLSVHGAPDCHYVGTVREDPSALGAFTLCDGVMHATVHSDDPEQSFTVQPVDLAPGSNHMVYRHSDIIPKHHTCGVENEVVPRAERVVVEDEEQHHEDHEDHDHSSSSSSSSSSNSASNDHTRRSRRSLPATATTKTIGIMVANDKIRFDKYGAATHNHAAQITQVANTLFQKLGVDITSTYKVQLEIVSMYTFSIKDPWSETPGLYDSKKEVFAGSNQQAGLLNAFNSWRSSNALPNDPINGHDVGHLLSGSEFQGATIGLASLHAVCQASLKSGITQAVNLADAQIASTMTHEIGHNLGMSHTDATPPEPVSGACDCKSNGNNPCNPSGTNYIMAASSAGTAHTAWSECSVAWLTAHFKAGSSYYDTNSYPACAETKLGTNDAPIWSGGSPVCGDGLRQGDEECDCPLGNCAGLDPCCDGATCKLLSGRQCSAQDPCCTASAQACTISSDTNKVCRAALSSDGCDYAEKCDGVNAQCPVDTFAATGEACTTAAYSATGICYNKQCHSHVDQCKTAGAAEGEDYLAPCTGRGSSGGDSACGNLYCSHDAGGSLTDCWQISIPVSQGTQCGTGKACFLGKCTLYSEIPVPGNLNCTNEVEDQDETDVDCGGTQCWGCDTNKKCKVDGDCIYPAKCNMTVVETGRNGTYGRCGKPAKAVSASTLCFGNPTCLALYNSAWTFISANPWVWAIVAVLAAMCLYSCCVPSHKHEGKKVTLAQKGLAQAGSSFRQLRETGSFRRTTGLQARQPDAEIPVATPVRGPMLGKQ